MTCPHCRDTNDVFGEKSARDDLRAYREKGASKTTRWLIDALRSAGVEDMRLLDIGGGVGAIPLALLEAGAEEATDVDASSAYIRAAKDEAERQGVRDRITYKHGDFVQMADEIDAADIVTLDKVVCCYPDMRALVEESTARAKNYYGVVFPRDNWLMRVGKVVINTFGFRLPGSAFRIYLHPVETIDRRIRDAGFTPTMQRVSWFWHVRLYKRLS